MTCLLLHDVSWSFHQGKFHELFFRDGITFATWGLVLVTGLLVWDGWRRGKEQRRRWTLEDKQREDDRTELRTRWLREDAKDEAGTEPRYALGIDVDDDGPYFWIANMGTTAFLAKTIFLNRNQFGTNLRVPLPTPWNEPVSVGSKRIYRLTEEAFFPRIPEIQSNAIYHCETSCTIIKANGIQMSSSKRLFDMYTDKNGAHMKTEVADY